MVSSLVSELIHNKSDSCDLSSLSVDSPFGGEVGLVSHQQFVHVLARVSVDLLQPLLHVVERFLDNKSI